ncbi:hypothetical protein KDL01_38615 [Actinospica durhamensis]|uniref:Uncharacterized protein n=1 Tax=Actinospica durhamensis TaxID=1508375 RepID=A0A941F1G2_9ACTN|nr:hypothetical protein [Actinospica durhamensis]MBR7839239.1 hypothetical protein [Actinospica durhamensis]
MQAFGRITVAVLLFTASLLAYCDFRGVLSWLERTNRRYRERDHHARLRYQVILSLLMCIAVLIFISEVVTLVKD